MFEKKPNLIEHNGYPPNQHFRKDEDWDDILDFEVTHWMPLPEPPKGITGEENIYRRRKEGGGYYLSRK